MAARGSVGPIDPVGRTMLPGPSSPPSHHDQLGGEVATEMAVVLPPTLTPKIWHGRLVSSERLAGRTGHGAG